MPSKNSIKEFVADSYYHLYNRGVEKRLIFIDSQDYSVFLSYLKTYLLPKDSNALQAILLNPDTNGREKDKAKKLLRLNNFADDVFLISYCLMPNHFHLLLKQAGATSIDRFMNSLCTRYAMYFNKKYKRVGVLFQDHYKAVRVGTEEQFLHLSRYIHRNPRKILASQGGPLKDYIYSSYPEYLGLKKSSWVNSNLVLDYFNKKDAPKSYKDFVEEKGIDVRIIKESNIDEEFD